MDDWQSMSGEQRKAFTLKLLAAYGARCCICGLEILPGTESCQHVIPRSKGGLTTMDNCRPAHRRCNSAAGNRFVSGPAGMIHDGFAWFNQ